MHYTVNGKNVVGMGAFKSYVGIWFFQGVFLQDKQQKLVNAQEGKTKAMRQWRFTALEEIDEQLLRQYIEEAIQNQKEGKEVKPERTKEVLIPAELSSALENQAELASCFGQLTPGKQREYAGYIHEAKRADTKVKRLEKIIPMILAGKGLNDRYKG